MYIAVGEDLRICHKNFAFHIFVFVDFMKLQLSRVSNDAVSIRLQQVCDVLYYKRKAPGEDRGIDAFHVGTLGSLIGSSSSPGQKGPVSPPSPESLYPDSRLMGERSASTSADMRDAISGSVDCVNHCSICM